ncbi:MAG: hypothetical protein ACO1SV_12455 [Fimbriimonas sp.]
MLTPGVLDKLRPAFNDVRPDEPAAEPFLEALNGFLGRWFGVGLADAVEFTAAGFTLATRDRGTVEVDVYAPASKGMQWAFDASFDGFGIDGVISVHIERKAMERSRCVRWGRDADRAHGRSMDIAFGVVRPTLPGGYPDFEKVYIREEYK